MTTVTKVKTKVTIDPNVMPELAKLLNSTPKSSISKRLALLAYKGLLIEQGLITLKDNTQDRDQENTNHSNKTEIPNDVLAGMGINL